MPISPQELLAGRTNAVENELLKVASACEGYGAELALLKLAEMEESAKEEKEEEEKEEKGESPKLSDEEKKEASAMGLYTFEGFINKLASAGQTLYGDPTIYIRALAIQNGSYEKVAGLKELWTSAKGKASKAKEYISGKAHGAAKGVGDYFDPNAIHNKGMSTGKLSPDDWAKAKMIAKRRMGLAAGAGGAGLGVGGTLGAQALMD